MFLGKKLYFTGKKVKENTIAVLHYDRTIQYNIYRILFILFCLFTSVHKSVHNTKQTSVSSRIPTFNINCSKIMAYVEMGRIYTVAQYLVVSHSICE